MKIGEFLKRIRLKSVQIGEGERSIDNVDAMTTPGELHISDSFGGGANAPTNWVPSDWGEDKPPQ